MDLYDLKPDAPAEYRGIWKPIRTRVPGFDVSELFPRQARVTDKFSIVRSLHHDTGDHFAGGHRMLTAKDLGVSGANNEQRFPSLGAIAARHARLRGGAARQQHRPEPRLLRRTLPGRPVQPLPDRRRPQRAELQRAEPQPGGGADLDRLEDRRSLVGHFDTARRHLEALADSQAMDRFSREAYDFVSGPAARRAFDVGKEDPRLRDRYGRNNWGQSTLLARRLVEAGSTFVTVHFGGWDHHWNLKAGMESYLPMVDSAVSALFTDLDERGLLSRTLVVLCGEFSRTPRMNDGGNGGAPMSMGTPGRDHWGNSMFCLLGGGGVKGGQIVGSTDRLGTRPHTRPVVPANIHATIYHVLGIDPKLQLLDPSGRPTPVLEDPEAIEELL
jgi:hypothetical protein